MSYNIDKTLPPERAAADQPEAPARLEEPTTAAELKDWLLTLELAQIQRVRQLPDADFVRVVRFGYSGSVWGKIKTGSFNGTIEKAIMSIKRALAVAQNSRAIDSDQGTVLFEHVVDAVAAVQIALAAHDEHRIVWIVGPGGSGKSSILNYLHRKFGGDMVNAHPDWAKSYFSNLSELAEGLGLSSDYRRAREAQRAILSDLKMRPRCLFVDEGNYFSKDGLNLIKAITNETRCPIIIGTLPNNLRRLNAEHNEEMRQVIRRAVAIISIPPVDSSMVTALHAARFPQVTLNGYTPQVAMLANKYHRIDTVVRVFEEADPGDVLDVPNAIARVERAIKVEGIK